MSKRLKKSPNLFVNQYRYSAHVDGTTKVTLYNDEGDAVTVTMTSMLFDSFVRNAVKEIDARTKENLQ